MIKANNMIKIQSDNLYDAALAAYDFDAEHAVKVEHGLKVNSDSENKVKVFEFAGKQSKYYFDRASDVLVGYEGWDD